MDAAPRSAEEIDYRASVSLTGNTSVTKNITRTEVASGRTSCTGGLRLTPADRTVTGTVVETQEVDDRGIGETTADVKARAKGIVDDRVGAAAGKAVGKLVAGLAAI